YILPIVELPSEPVMQVMDAGAIDNYGTQTAVKYLFEFREWFAANTSGVYFLQIRDNYREDPIRFGEKPSLFSSMMRPLGGGLYSMAEARDMANDYLLEYVQEWYEGAIEVIPVEYPRESFEQPASLSWHLTQREKQSIQRSLDNAQNKAIFARLGRCTSIRHWFQPALRNARVDKGVLRSRDKSSEISRQARNDKLVFLWLCLLYRQLSFRPQRRNLYP
ncbi:MAG: hypothetical protein AAFQ68_29200, partial [Bacteroidota bacterium]